MNDKPKRRWFQFSLRTLFVIVTMAAPVFAWVGYSLNLIRERQRMVLEHSFPMVEFERVSAPSGLWILGEKGKESLAVAPGYGEAARRLFPEADVFEWHPDWALNQDLSPLQIAPAPGT